MIYSILILLSSLLLFPVYSFYITNAGVLEQCASPTIVHIDKFDPTKMHCINQAWRQTFLFLEYSCIRNTFTRIWTIKTNTGKKGNWPQAVSLITGAEYTHFTKMYLNDDPTIEENSNGFDPNQNPLTTYLWTDLSNGPQCRIRYSIMKDICTANRGAVGAKFTEFVCYYGQQPFNLQTIDQRHALDKLLDEGRQPSSNTIPNNPTHQNHSGTDTDYSQLNPNHHPSNFEPSALNDKKPSFLMKNKKYIIIGGIFLVVISIVGIGFLIMRSSSKKKIEEKISNESTFD